MIRKTLITLLFIILPIASGAKSLAYDPNTVIIKLKPDAKLPQLREILHARHLFANTWILKTEQRQELEKRLSDNDDVLRLYKNYRSQKKDFPQPEINPPNIANFQQTIFNDPQVGRQWSFRDASEHGVSVLKAYKSLTNRSKKTVIVAVVDTGVDFQHPDLKNIMWKNPGEIAGNSIDDDGNGYVDDVHGISTLERDEKGNATGNPLDQHNHGTHVAGIIAAEQNNNQGIAGIASNVKIMALRTVPSRSDETDVDVAESFIYAAKNGAKLINCSFGKRHNEGGSLVFDTIQHIGEKYGVLVIAAAGNDSTDTDRTRFYPSTLENENLLTVASTTSRGGRSYFSNFGRITVDLGAPGSGIYSTVRNGRYASYSGTSMAAPTTTGVAAEILSQYPDLSPIELKRVLMSSVVEIDGLRGKTVSHGRVDLFQAFEKAKSL